jgi:hypothetical protein
MVSIVQVSASNVGYVQVQLLGSRADSRIAYFLTPATTTTNVSEARIPQCATQQGMSRVQNGTTFPLHHSHTVVAIECFDDMQSMCVLPSFPQQFSPTELRATGRAAYSPPGCSFARTSHLSLVGGTSVLRNYVISTNPRKAESWSVE